MHIHIGLRRFVYPSGAISSIFFLGSQFGDLKGVPISLLWALGMFYSGTWNLWVEFLFILVYSQPSSPRGLPGEEAAVQPCRAAY